MNYYELLPEKNTFSNIVVDLTHRCNMECANCYIPNRDIPDFEKHIDTSYKRPGQDVRYALRCDYLKQYGWQPKREFDKEIVNLVKHYAERFIW